jgi:hypothetical protein
VRSTLDGVYKFVITRNPADLTNLALLTDQGTLLLNPAFSSSEFAYTPVGQTIPFVNRLIYIVGTFSSLLQITVVNNQVNGTAESMFSLSRAPSAGWPLFVGTQIITVTSTRQWPTQPCTVHQSSMSACAPNMMSLLSPFLFFLACVCIDDN